MFKRPPKQTIIGSFQDGEVSLYASEKNPKGSFTELMNCRSFRRQIEAIGGINALCAIAGTNRMNGGKKWKGRYFLWYTKNDGGTDYTYLGEFNPITSAVTDLIDPSTSNLIRYTETRDPRIDTSPEAMFFTFGTTVKKVKLNGSNQVIVAPDLTGASNVVAIAFGDNRIHAGNLDRMIFTDIVAGGDVTSFNNSADNEWADGGEFPTTFDENLTNIMYLNNRVVGFSPSQVEVKQLQEVQEDVLGTVKSVKKEITIGEVPGIGTSTFRDLAKFDSKVFFIDERTRKLHFIIPRENQNEEIENDEIDINARNLEELDFKDYYMAYIPLEQSIIFPARTNANASSFDRMIWFNPKEGKFSRTDWSSSFAMVNDEGRLYFGADDSNQFIEHTPDSYTDLDDEKMKITIEWNRMSVTEFWKKFKAKKLALWLALNPDDTVKLSQSLDGAEWQEILLDQDIEIPSGQFVTPRALLGRTAMNSATRNLAQEIIEFIAGKIRNNAKCTTIKFKIELDIQYKFVLKSWAITDYRTSGTNRYKSISKEN